MIDACLWTTQASGLEMRSEGVSSHRPGSARPPKKRRDRLILRLALLASVSGGVMFSGCGGGARAGPSAATAPNDATTSTADLATTTTATTSPFPAEIEEWLLAAKLPYTALAADIGVIGAAVSAVNDIGSGESTSPGSLSFVLGNGACSGLQRDLASADALPSAPIPQIQKDWQAQLSPFASILADCNSAVAGNDPDFPQQWPALAQTVVPPADQLETDLTSLGYCFPSATCAPPYSTSG